MGLSQTVMFFSVKMEIAGDKSPAGTFDADLQYVHGRDALSV